MLSEPESGEKLSILDKHTRAVYCLAFSQDGKILASGSLDGTVRLWDVQTGEEKGEPLKHPPQVQSVAISPDGRVLVTGGYKSVWLWDMAQRNKRPRMLPWYPGRDRSVRGLVFSRDGKTLLSFVEDRGPIILWDFATDKELRRWELPGPVQVVAVKVLPPSKAKEPETLARFRREARLGLKLNHPGVVKTFEIGTAGDLNYLIMEYLEGETLEALLKERGKLPSLEAVRIAYLTALAMQHFHKQGLVHRDLNSGNLMLCPAPPEGENTLRSRVKILDIGLGRTLFDPRADAVSDGLTSEENILGSPDYLAPEQARDARRVDIRADIYSLGCTLYHMVAERPPFPDDNPVRQIMRHANEDAKPLRELNPAIPATLSQVVGKMLAKDPADRYPTPAGAATALQSLLALGPTRKTGHHPKP